MIPLINSKLIQLKLVTPMQTKKNSTIQFHECLTLLKSSKKLILNSKSYQKFLNESKENNNLFESKYPTITRNNSSNTIPNLKTESSSKDLKKSPSIKESIASIPKPKRLLLKKQLSRNKPIGQFNTVSIDKYKSADNSPSRIRHTPMFDSKNNIPETISIKSFLDEISNVKNAINNNSLYQFKVKKSENELIEHVNSIFNAFIVRKKIKEEDISALNSSFVKTIHLSNRYIVELKIVSFSINFKDQRNANYDATISLPFEYIIFFLCCHKQIEFIHNIIDYSDETKSFNINNAKFRSLFISQISPDWLKFTYKEPISSLWITSGERYHFTSILPQMTFTLYEIQNNNNHKQCCYFTKLIEPNILVNLLKENFFHWELLVLNTFSIYKSFRNELFEIFSKKQLNPMNRSFSKVSINNNNTRFNFFHSKDIKYNENNLIQDNAQLNKMILSQTNWEFISTINKESHCYCFYSFKIEIKIDGGITRTLQLSLRQLQQIILLSDQWSPYETIRRLISINENGVPVLNLNANMKIENNNTTNTIGHKIKKSASIDKNKELPLYKRLQNGYSYIENDKIKCHIIDPYFMSEERVVSLLPMDILMELGKRDFDDWPEVMKKHYDNIFKRKFEESPINKKKAIRSSKSLKIGQLKRRFQNN